MDFTKLFEPVRGIVGYLISRMGTLFISVSLLFINFDFRNIFNMIYVYYGENYAIFMGVVNFLSADDKILILSILSMIVFVGVIEIHSTMLMFFDKLSPISFVGRPAYYDSFDYNIGFLWKCYHQKMTLADVRTLHGLRRSIEEKEKYSRQSEIFDFVSGWIFLLVIVSLFLPVKSSVIFITTIVVLLLSGWMWAYRQAGEYSLGFEESQRASFWLYEHRLHDPVHLNEEQEEELLQLRDMTMNSQTFREPGASIRISWLDFLYRLFVPRALRDKVQSSRFKYEMRIRYALKALLGDQIKRRY